MLTPANLHSYQVRAAQHILDHPRSMLWLDLGLGKTASTLTPMATIFNMGLSNGALILAPLRVCQSVWAQEAAKWSHTRHLTFSLVHGKPRHRKLAITKHAHFYLLNYEALPWFVAYVKEKYLFRGRRLPFDTIIMDEITKLKSTRDPNSLDDPGGSRGAALMEILPYLPRRIGLTGTPSPNTIEDLFGQYLVLDSGATLGNSIRAFRERFFTPSGYGGHSFDVTEQGREYIHRLVADITIEMKGEDYLELPKVVENVVDIPLTPVHQEAYDALERELWMELDSGATIEAVNSLSLISKLLQFTNGAIYQVPESPEWEQIHKLKLDALEDLFTDNGEKPMLVAYQFQHDRERIVKRFKKYGVVVMDGKMTTHDINQTITDWNTGKIKMLVGHAASIGHGLNLQYGSNQVVWFGLSYNLELYLQFVGRLARQGQPESHVFVHKLLCPGTIDDVVNAALAFKDSNQTALRAALSSYRRERGM